MSPSFTFMCFYFVFLCFQLWAPVVVQSPGVTLEEGFVSPVHLVESTWGVFVRRKKSSDGVFEDVSPSFSSSTAQLCNLVHSTLPRTSSARFYFGSYASFFSLLLFVFAKRKDADWLF